MKLKKVTSLFLVATMLFSFTSSVFAVGDSSNDSVETLESTVQQLQSMYPHAEITLDKNNVLQVYTPPEESTGVSLMSASTTNTQNPIYAPEGGTYRGFKPPWYVSLFPNNYQHPYAIVYLPAAQAYALYMVLNDRSILDVILSSSAAGEVASAIACKVMSKFGIPFQAAHVLFVIASTTYSIYDNLDKYSLQKAINSSEDGSVRIAYTTLNGWPSNMYSPWDGNTVNCSPFESWKPTFYFGEFNL